MGCDMHCVIEALNKKTGNWDCFGVSTSFRNYQLYSRIAVVRNSEDESTYIEPICDLRGWPYDASEPAEAWYEYNDLSFSHTFLCRKELEALNKWTKEHLHGDLLKYLEFNHLSYLFNLEESWKKAAFTRYSDLRIIFFFSI